MLHVQFTGRLGADAETKKINDTTVTNFSVATDESFEKDAPAIWLRCALWGKRGETVSEFLEKGKLVMITGTMVPREYENKDKETKVSYDVRVNEVELLGGGSKSEEKEPSAKNGRSSGRDARRTNSKIREI